MNIANTLAVLMGSALVIVGITLFNKSYFSAVMADLASNKGLLWVTGFITFVMGMVSTRSTIYGALTGECSSLFWVGSL